MVEKKYDYLIVGCGLFGSVFAREMTDNGFSCLIIDKRDHIGGNVYTEEIEGINVHKYGAHIFHTNDKSIWDYVNRFAAFNNYRHKVFVNHKNHIYSFPVNLMTMVQLWNVNSPEAAKRELESRKIHSVRPANLEEWVLSQIGEDLYKIFIRDYTIKQWGRDPKLLPSSIIKRIPIRTDFNDFYFDDKYQGIPIGGYTKMISNMLAKIEVKTGVDYFLDKKALDELAVRTVYTGNIDQFFDYRFGQLEYRSLEFETSIFDKSSFQGTSVINYTDLEVPFTRILEHKYFDFVNSDKTVITREFPNSWNKGKESYYPICDKANNEKYDQYRKYAQINCPDILFGGRLAEYKYYDMHQVIGSALAKSKSILQSVPSA